MRKPSVDLSPYRNASRPELKWSVSWPSPDPKKPRLRRRFKTRTAAVAFRDLRAVETLNESRESNALGPVAREQAVAALRLLQPYGVSILDAAKAYVAQHEARRASALVPDAVAGFIDQKERDGASVRYLADLRSRLGRFAKRFENVHVSDVTPAEVSRWLASLRLSPTTRNNMRRVAGVFLGWCQKRRLCEGNAALAADAARMRPEPVAIFTPSELRQILDAAPPDLLPVLAIGSFAGLRQAEIARLNWSNINFLRGHIEVPAAAAKSASRRLVPLSSVLRAWLEPHANPSGPVPPVNLNARLRKWRRKLEKAGGPEWVNNGLRHSFASYELARTQDAAATSLILGHGSPAMLFRHYRERVTPEDARKWFEVMPRDGETIIAMDGKR